MHRWRLEGLVLLPIIGALIVIWALAIWFKASERTTTLERARTQLTTTVSILADFSELSEKAVRTKPDERTAERTAAIWRALIEYPAASVWVEVNGSVVDGRPPSGTLGPYIFVEERRANITVHAALPENDALTTWRRETWWGAALLAFGSLAFAAMTQLLVSALRRRNEAERDAALAVDRAAHLSEFQVELQRTVADRTQELQQANLRLEEELRERQAAEETLREHDALLNAVTKSAAELLGQHGYEDAIAVILELIGQTIAVSRIQLSTVVHGTDGHLHATPLQEWCEPGLSLTIDNPNFQNIDLTAQFPKAVAPMLTGQPYAFFAPDIAEESRAQYLAAKMQSFLQIPVMIEGRLWGTLTFVDSADSKRKWSWAETDVLETLAGLIGVAIVRARYVKELADANMIVQNSPTILYRLRGEPSLPLAYISPNIAKFGFNPAKLIAAANWSELLIDPVDQAKFGDAMTKALHKGAHGGTIEFRLHTDDNTRRWFENRYTPIRDKLDRLVEIEGIIIDITERKIAEEKLSLLARTDNLTGLANRATFVDRLRQAYAASKRGANPFAVLYMDVDHFKDVNDTLGHPAGDLLLKAIADRLKIQTRENDVVARLGGDEFAILQTETNDPAAAGELAAKLLHALSEPYALQDNSVHVTVSIGVAAYASSTSGPDVVLSQADLALYRAKEQGRNQYRFHSEDLDTQVRERVNLAAELREAFEHEQLELYYQPQVDVRTGTIIGVEALVRWDHPTRGLLVPIDFFPAAEQTGAIMPLGHWILDRACRQMRQWIDQGIAPPVMTVNLSLIQLKNAHDLIQDVADVLARWTLPASMLEFDVTEATLAQLKWTHNDVLIQLRRLGVKIAIDEFGMEYSSFDYLKSYNVSHLKIARSLIAKAVTDPERADLIRVMIAMGRDLGIGVMAEGVETEEQRGLLISTGSPTKAQGFYFSEPVDSTHTTELLRRHLIEPRSGARVPPPKIGASRVDPGSGATKS